MNSIAEISEVTFENARKAHERWIIKNNKKDLDAAIEYYSKTLAVNPAVSECYYRLAMLLWESGQISLSTAIDKCFSAVTVSPNNINARLYAGYFLKLAGRFDEAEIQFKHAIKTCFLSSSRARMNLGLMLSERIFKGDFKISFMLKSLYYLSTGALIGVCDYPFINMWAKKLSENISINKYLLVGNFYKLFGSEVNAVKAFKTGCEKTGRFEIFNRLIGDIAVKHENMQLALKSYERVLEVNPKDREALLKKATILQTYFEEKFDETIETYNSALETKGNKDYIYYELGHLYLKNNDIVNSISAFKLAVQEDSTNAFFHNALGYALFKAGQFEDAEDHYLVAINLNPDHEWTSTVCKATALLYSDIMKNYEKAVRMYEHALALTPNSADIYLALGDLYFDMEDYDLAIRYYSKVIELNQADAYLFNKYATALWQKGFTEEAIITYKHAISLNPEYAPCYNNLGVIYLDKKILYEEAKNYFEKAVFYDKEYTLAYFNLGRAYEALGNKILSATFYSEAISMNKIKKEITDIDIQERINKLFEV